MLLTDSLSINVFLDLYFPQETQQIGVTKIFLIPWAEIRINDKFIKLPRESVPHQNRDSVTSNENLHVSIFKL